MAAQIHGLSRFEGCKTNYMQTESIVQGRNPHNASLHDVEVIINLARGARYLLEHITQESILNISLLRTINRIVAAQDSLDAGALRTGRSGVTLMNGSRYEPAVISENELTDALRLIAETSRSKTEAAIHTMLYLMRAQAFWDGNKRTAAMFANAVMLKNGCGVIEIPEALILPFNEHLSDYYRSNNMEAAAYFVYENCLNGWIPEERPSENPHFDNHFDNKADLGF